MENYQVHPVGKFHASEEGFSIEVEPSYRSALTGLEGFSYLMVIWWFSEFDTEEARNVTEVPQPYKGAPETLGIFATRSPVRPNPIGITTVMVLDIDKENGIITIPYTDAYEGTPILDIKPYTPSNDRVENPQVPAWSSHWPKNVETSGEFDWENEFNF